jgi:hypothetical protein
VVSKQQVQGLVRDHGKVFVSCVHFSEILNVPMREQSFSINSPIEVVDILYVSKKGGSVFSSQGKFCLVPDAVKVIL